MSKIKDVLKVILAVLLFLVIIGIVWAAIVLGYSVIVGIIIKGILTLVL